MEVAWRLVWALPLVLAVGIVAMLLLKRFLVPAPARGRAQRMSLCESLALSDHTRVHVIEVDGSAFVVIESTQQAALQSVSQSAEPSRPATQLRASWARRFNQAARR